MGFCPTYRHSDRRGGANGARIALTPQRQCEVNNPTQLNKVLDKLEQIKDAFNGDRKDGQLVSLADLIILEGNVAVEKAARNAGFTVQVPFHPGRIDASEEETDAQSFTALEPVADGFRNYRNANHAKMSTEELLIDKAELLRLTAPEMTVLIAGIRALGTNYDLSSNGVLTDQKETLTNDFFVNLLSMDTQWSPIDASQELFVGTDLRTKKEVYCATRVDFIFGSHSELRAIAEVYASQDAKEKFVIDFVAAWSKVMELDRFDLKK